MKNYEYGLTMNKRKFGMRVLNISQSRFNDFSHKNLNAYDLIGQYANSRIIVTKIHGIKGEI